MSCHLGQTIDCLYILGGLDIQFFRGVSDICEYEFSHIGYDCQQLSKWRSGCEHMGCLVVPIVQEDNSLFHQITGFEPCFG
jgi:hypothetical protein